MKAARELYFMDYVTHLVKTEIHKWLNMLHNIHPQNFNAARYQMDTHQAVDTPILLSCSEIQAMLAMLVPWLQELIPSNMPNWQTRKLMNCCCICI